MSAVSAIVEWPGRLLTTARATPAASCRLAEPYRRSCSRLTGNPARAAMGLNCRLKCNCFPVNI